MNKKSDLNLLIEALENILNPKPGCGSGFHYPSALLIMAKEIKFLRDAYDYENRMD